MKTMDNQSWMLATKRTQSELSNYYSDEDLDSNNNLIGEEARAYSALQGLMVLSSLTGIRNFNDIGVILVKS